MTRSKAVFRSVALRVVGASSGFALMLLLAEGYLRIAPPEEIRPFVVGDAKVAGPYRSHPAYTMSYRDIDAFRAENATRLAELAPMFDPGFDKPIWAFFGNSFVQASGMLASAIDARVNDRAIFFLGQNTPLPIRFAQVDLLLDMGLRPERIFFSIMPIDTLIIGRFPLDRFRVTESGGLAYDPRMPPGLAGELTRLSRIAFATWVRTNNHRGNRTFSLHAVRRGEDGRWARDLLSLFEALADTAMKAGVPVTVLMIPDEEQIVGEGPFGFQETLSEQLAYLKFDFFDPRADLLAHSRREQLFIPDGHYAEAGNSILSAALLRHIGWPAR